MDRFHFAAVLAAGIGFASVASAADMPTKAPIYKTPTVASGYSWTGFYLGVNGGYGVGRNPSSLINFTNPAPGTLQIADSWNFDPAGVLGGVQAGYNYQIDRWVIGIEADFQATGQKDTVCRVCTPGASSFNVEQKLPWFGTVRGRFGWAAGPVFSYFTGGWAYGQVQTDINLPIIGLPTTGGATHEFKSGWVIGSGVEAALAGNWTARVEYLYMSLGSTEVPFFNSATGGTRTMVTSDIRNHIIRAGLNYRFGPTAGSGSATSPAPTFRNWAGFYAGGNGGYGVARDPSVLATSVATVPVTQFNDQWNESPGGYFGGVQFGYGWQTGQFVYGLEADIQGGNLKDSACLAICGLSSSISNIVDQKITWFGTVRGRAGYAAGPALFYVTGGLAYGNVTTTLTEFVPTATTTASTSSTNAGWTIGGGAEVALWGNWTAKTEYLYMDLGSTSLSVASIWPGVGAVSQTLSSDFRTHIFRGGLNYHF
jgi:outer membrane immunogenic protein